MELVRSVVGNQSCSLVLEEQVSTTAMKCVVVMAKMVNNNGTHLTGAAMLEPDEELMTNTGTLVARVLVDASKDRVPVQLMFLQDPRCLEKGTVLGELECIEHSNTLLASSECPVYAVSYQQSHSAFLSQFNWTETRLSPQEKGVLEQMLLQNRQLFSKDPSDMGRTTIVKHHIPTPRGRPFKYQPHRIPHHLKPVMERTRLMKCCKKCNQPISQSLVITNSPSQKERRKSSLLC